MCLGLPGSYKNTLFLLCWFSINVQIKIKVQVFEWDISTKWSSVCIGHRNSILFRFFREDIIIFDALLSMESILHKTAIAEMPPMILCPWITFIYVRDFSAIYSLAYYPTLFPTLKDVSLSLSLITIFLSIFHIFKEPFFTHSVKMTIQAQYGYSFCNCTSHS